MKQTAITDYYSLTVEELGLTTVISTGNLGIPSIALGHARGVGLATGGFTEEVSTKKENYGIVPVCTGSWRESGQHQNALMMNLLNSDATVAFVNSTSQPKMDPLLSILFTPMRFVGVSLTTMNRNQVLKWGTKLLLLMGDVNAVDAVSDFQEFVRGNEVKVLNVHGSATVPGLINALLVADIGKFLSKALYSIN